MSEQPPLRPVGTEFEEVTETQTERILTTLRVMAHQEGGDGFTYEIVQQVKEVIQPKTPPAPSERK